MNESPTTPRVITNPSVPAAASEEAHGAETEQRKSGWLRNRLGGTRATNHRSKPKVIPISIVEKDETIEKGRLSD
jgi:hypothetical protein